MTNPYPISLNFKSILVLFLYVLSLNSYSQNDYVDTTKKYNTTLFGIEASTNYIDLGGGTPFWQNSIGVFYKRTIFSIGIRCSYTNKLSISYLTDLKKNIIGPSASIGLDLYQFKDIIVIPVSLDYHYYRRNFVDNGTTKSRYVLSSYAFRAGIYVKPTKWDLTIFGNIGITFLSVTNSYIHKTIGHTYRSGGIQPNVEFGLNYSVYSQKKQRK